LSSSASSGRAPLVLAAALFALALPIPTPRFPPCTSPRALGGGAIHTRAVACAEGAPGGPLRGAARLLYGLPIDPNSADAETLALLPGIGPARAAAIVRARRERPFDTPDALLRVHGIGPVTLARMRPWIATPGAAAASPAAAPAPLQPNR
jgi:competence protein ComEA